MEQAYHVNFSPESLLALNVILGLILFGIAIDLRKEDFIILLNRKKSAIAGLVAHFIILPLLTYALAYLLAPPPEIALGMVLIAACPGGNMANMFSYLAKANTALSVGLTSVSHILAIFLTPLNFAIYGRLLPGTEKIFQQISVDPVETVLTVLLVIVLPLALGLYLAAKSPKVAARIRPYMKKIALGAFAIFLVAAIASNVQTFVDNVTTIFPIVVLHNALALLAGYLLGRSLKVPEGDARTIAFETGVQNAGLGLVIVFNFFQGSGGMAVVVAIWGVWHLISGGILANIWSRRYALET